VAKKSGKKNDKKSSKKSSKKRDAKDLGKKALASLAKRAKRVKKSAEKAAKKLADKIKRKNRAKTRSLEKKAKAGMKRDRALAKKVPLTGSVSAPRPSTVEPSESWTVVALRARARKLAVPGFSRMSKGELLEKLRG
jgi:hypothetical protein